jgi:hypothetical protein
MQIENIDPGLVPFLPEFLDKRIEEINGLGAEPDLSIVSGLAHQWKGFSRPYGFIELEEISLKLKKAADDGDKSSSKDLLAEAYAYCLSCREKLKAI